MDCGTHFLTHSFFEIKSNLLLQFVHEWLRLYLKSHAQLVEKSDHLQLVAANEL